MERSKQYRRVIAQQGRVELEADKNEGAELAAEAQRLETLDIVGPYGVPSDPLTSAAGTGYQIAPADPIIELAPGAPPSLPDFKILPGTIYVGGLRVEQEQPNLTFLGQASGDWLPRPLQDDATGNKPGTLESVVLQLSEHEVSAVEDGSLRELAIGGPDTTQRLRLTRRVHRFTVTDRSCGPAFAQVVAEFARRGFGFDPRTMALTSVATLQVTPDASPLQTDPCDPIARGGYLGAENQMIRVQLTDPLAAAGNSAQASETPQFLWAYDNASDLFAVAVDASRPRRLLLGTAPVDTFHWPRAQQFVEVLVASVKLADDGYEASESGRVFRLAADYDPDTGSVTLDADLDASVFDSRAVFLRVWQNRQELIPGKPVELVDKAGSEIGLAVTIGGALTTWAFQAGQAWSFAVRPGAPEAVFPARYAKAAQSPEGPRQWLAPLAFIDWSENGPLISDCRPRFDDLVQLTAAEDETGGCCTLHVKPADAPQLQAIVDRLQGRHGVTLCFGPGMYVLTEPLRLNAQHSGLTLEGGEGKVVLTPDGNALAAFGQGMVELTQATEITFRNIEFRLASVKLGAVPSLLRGVVDASSAFAVAFGLRPVNSEIELDHCAFVFSPKDDGNVVGAAIFASGDTRLGLRDSTFTGTPGSLSGASVLLGVLLTPSVVVALGNDGLVKTGSSLAAHLQRAVLEGNRFVGLRIAALLVGSHGQVHVAENDVSTGYMGLVVTSLEPWGGSKDLSALAPRRATLAAALEAIDSDRWLRLAYALGAAYPLPSGASTGKRVELPGLTPGHTFESVAASATASLRNSLLRELDGTTEERSARATAAEAAPRAIDVLSSRDAIELPADVRVPSRPLDVVLWNIAGLAGAVDPQGISGASIHVQNNDVDLGASGVASRCALAVFDSSSNVVLNANRATSMYPLIPTVLVVAKRSAVSGNVVVNYASAGATRPQRASFLDHGQQLMLDLNLAGYLPESSALQRHSLAVIPHASAGSASTVISSNLCEGSMLVPQRAASAGPPWQQLNTEVP